MKIRKETPSWHVIADSKINTQTLTKYTEKLGVDFETNWIKSNGKAQTVSQAEKLLELLASDFLGVQNDKFLPSNEFLSAHIGTFSQLFDHFSVTIIFDEVSHLFLQNLLMEKLNLYINQKRCNDMSLWLPPAFEHPIIGTTYGRMIGEITSNIERFVDEAKKNNVAPEDALKAAFSMMPLAQHSKLIVTASMSNWRQILLSLSKFSTDIETRYIIMHLFKDLKMRYFGFFCDMSFIDKNGKAFGSGSIDAEGFWKNVEIKKP